MSDFSSNALSLIEPDDINQDMQKLGSVAAARKQVKSAHDGLDIDTQSQISYTSKLKLKSGDQPRENTKLSLVDTHAHIHDPEFKFSDPDEIIKQAEKASVSTILVVGTSVEDSFLAAEFALKYNGVFAIIGSHPHEAKKDLPKLHELENLLRDTKLNKKIVGIGETGLDFYYNNSPRGAQMESLQQQLSLADKFNLPVSFHVREAFDDFWFIYDKFKPRGVLHSFTDSEYNMKKALERGLYFGVNGISTFTKDAKQLEMFDSIPLERIILETDAPFLTPKPNRGKMNVPAYVKLVAEDISNKRDLKLADVARVTTSNACFLFNLTLPT
jgi:TatD DNase family protein